MNEVRLLFGMLGVLLWIYGFFGTTPPMSYLFSFCGGCFIGFLIWGSDNKKGGR